MLTLLAFDCGQIFVDASKGAGWLYPSGMLWLVHETGNQGRCKELIALPLRIAMNKQELYNASNFNSIHLPQPVQQLGSRSDIRPSKGFSSWRI